NGNTERQPEKTTRCHRELLLLPLALVLYARPTGAERHPPRTHGATFRVAGPLPGAPEDRGPLDSCGEARMLGRRNVLAHRNRRARRRRVIRYFELREIAIGGGRS